VASTLNEVGVAPTHMIFFFNGTKSLKPAEQNETGGVLF